MRRASGDKTEALAVAVISALLGDGIWDAVSAVALGIPCLLGFWFGMRRTPAQRSAL